jgi:hypothetical protein
MDWEETETLMFLSGKGAEHFDVVDGKMNKICTA